MNVIITRKSRQVLHGRHISLINTLKPGQNGQHFADIFKSIFF